MREVKRALMMLVIGAPLILFMSLFMVLMGENTASTHESVTIVTKDGFAVPFSPNTRYTVTSSFGYRTDPVYGGGAFHSGLDLAAPLGTPILATSDGIVEDVGGGGALGNYVFIKHQTKDNVLYSGYGHMKDASIIVKKGQVVKLGDKIGEVGSTGKSTGPHLHFMICKGRVSFNEKDLIDPVYIINNAE